MKSKRKVTLSADSRDSRGLNNDLPRAYDQPKFFTLLLTLHPLSIGIY